MQLHLPTPHPRPAPRTAELSPQHGQCPAPLGWRPDGGNSDPSHMSLTRFSGSLYREFPGYLSSLNTAKIFTCSHRSGAAAHGRAALPAEPGSPWGSREGGQGAHGQCGSLGDTHALTHRVIFLSNYLQKHLYISAGSTDVVLRGWQATGTFVLTRARLPSTV